MLPSGLLHIIWTDIGTVTSKIAIYVDVGRTGSVTSRFNMWDKNKTQQKNYRNANVKFIHQKFIKI